MYIKTINEALEAGLKGFDLDKRPQQMETDHGEVNICEAIEMIEKFGVAPR